MVQNPRMVVRGCELLRDGSLRAALFNHAERIVEEFCRYGGGDCKAQADSKRHTERIKGASNNASDLMIAKKNERTARVAGVDHCARLHPYFSVGGCSCRVADDAVSHTERMAKR